MDHPFLAGQAGMLRKGLLYRRLDKETIESQVTYESPAAIKYRLLNANDEYIYVNNTRVRVQQGRVYISTRTPIDIRTGDVIEVKGKRMKVVSTEGTEIATTTYTAIRETVITLT